MIDFKTPVTLCEDINETDMYKSYNNAREVVKEWIDKINHSYTVAKSMDTAIKSLQESGINCESKRPSLRFVNENLNKYRYRICVYKGDQNLLENVVPTDLLAKKISEDSRIKDDKNVRAVRFDESGNIYIEFCDDLPTDHVFVVNEAYIGKTQNLLAIEAKFDELRRTIKKEDYGVFDTLPLVQDINTLFEAQFGMDIFSLHLDPMVFPNAWTATVSYKFDLQINDTIKSNGIFATQRDGYKYKPNNGLAVVSTITAGLLFNMDITSEEIVGTLLHEIGHNFADYFDPALRAYNSNYILDIYDYMMVDATLHAIGKWKPETQRMMSNWADYEDSISPRSEGERKAEYKKNKKTEDAQYFRYCLRRLLSAFTLGIPTAIINLLRIPMVAVAQAKAKTKAEFMNRTNEMAADKFATVYGYGPAVQSGLAKMSSSKDVPIDNIIDNVPVISALLAFERIPTRMLINIYDEHPSLIARIDDQIWSLTQELKKKNMSPELRKAAEDDLKQLNRLKDDITATGKKVLVSEGIEHWWNRYLEGHMDKDSMAKVSKRLNEEMDKIIKKQK